MRKKNEAQEFFEEYDTLVFMIKAKIEQRNMWAGISESITAQMGGERVQSSGDQQRMASAVVKYLDIDNEIKEMYKQIKHIEKVIKKLKGNKRKVIHMRYVQMLSFKEIGFLCHKNESWATTIHGRALQDVQRILDNGRKKRITVQDSQQGA